MTMEEKKKEKRRLEERNMAKWEKVRMTGRKETVKKEERKPVEEQRHKKETSFQWKF
jgi:hypothetical protein